MLCDSLQRSQQSEHILYQSIQNNLKSFIQKPFQHSGMFCIKQIIVMEAESRDIHQTDQKIDQQYFQDCHQDRDLAVSQLSGEENTSKSIVIANSNNHQPKTNFMQSVTIIVKTVIGSGIIAMPYTINKMGWVFGTILFVAAGMANQFTSVLLIKAKNLSGHSNYSTIFYSIWQNKLAKCIGYFVVFPANIGVCIAEIIILKSSIRNILEENLGAEHPVLDQFYASEVFIALLVALLQIPTIMIKKIQKLRFMALCGVAGILIFMTSFVVLFVQASISQNSETHPVGNMRMFPSQWFKAASAVPNIIFALSFQMNLFPVFKGMKNANDSKMKNVTLVSITCCTLSYLLIGILGYYYVGDTVEVNFLNSLPYQKISKAFYFIIKISFLVSIFFALPLMFFAARNTFIAFLQLLLLKKKELAQDALRNAENIQRISSFINQEEPALRKKKVNLHFYLYTLGLYLVVIIVGMVAHDLEAFFNIIGSLTVSSLCIILPCFFYFRLVQLKKKQRSVKYFVSKALFVVAVPYFLFAIVALYIQTDS